MEKDEVVVVRESAKSICCAFDNFRRARRAADGKKLHEKWTGLCAAWSVKAGGVGVVTPHCKARLAASGNLWGLGDWSLFMSLLCKLPNFGLQLSSSTLFYAEAGRSLDSFAYQGEAHLFIAVWLWTRKPDCTGHCFSRPRVRS